MSGRKRKRDHSLMDGRDYNTIGWKTHKVSFINLHNSYNLPQHTNTFRLRELKKNERMAKIFGYPVNTLALIIYVCQHHAAYNTIRYHRMWSNDLMTYRMEGVYIINLTDYVIGKWRGGAVGKTQCPRQIKWSPIRFKILDYFTIHLFLFLY